jgi:hypothetical protein
MKQTMKQRSSYQVARAMGVCGLFLMLGAGYSALAQQSAAKSTVQQNASAFASVPFSALQAGAASQAAKPKVAVSEEDEEAKPSKPSKPGSEGIKVHGHWVLQVKNADGTLGERREFNNSLVTSVLAFGNSAFSTSGAELLAGALSGNVAVGNPAIGFLQGPVGSEGTPDIWCQPTVGGGGPSPDITCFIYATTNSLWNLGTIPGSNIGATSLGLNISVSFFPSANLILTGNYTVPTGLTQISAVQSLYGVCAPKTAAYISADANGNLPSYYVLNGAGHTVRTADVAATTCTAANVANSTTDVPVLGALTSTIVTANGVAAPLTVTPGQIVNVTVTLSFS